MSNTLVYIQNCCSYIGEHIRGAINARAADRTEISSSLANNDVASRLVLYNPEGKSVGERVAEADVIILNLFDDLDESAAIIKAIRGATLTRSKLVVCLSTISTWAGAKCTEEAPADERLFLGRMPSAAVARYKILETLVINSSGDLLSTTVIAAGIIYGNGEHDLHALFKQAWLGNALPVVGAGNNIIPTIHVADLASLIVRIVENPPKDRPYIIATDKSCETQQSIVSAISKTLSTGAIQTVSEADAVIYRDTIEPHIAIANVFVARATSFISGLKMEWKCETGIVASIMLVVNEFIAKRNLRPIRICIIGSPGSGRTFWTKRIASHFHLPIVAIRDLIAIAKQRGVNLQLGNDGRAPVRVIASLLRTELNRNEIRKKGYVLDGYPRSAEEAKALFDLATTESSSSSSDSASSEQMRIVPIVADRVVSLTTADSVAIARIKENPGAVIPGHSDEKGQKRRLASWNKMTSGENAPRIWFTNIAGVEILDVNTTDSIVCIDEAVNRYIGGGSPPENYHLTKPEKEEEGPARQEIDQEDHEQIEDQHEAEKNAKIEGAEREDVLCNPSSKEMELITERARPLRQFLADRVLPHVVEGLIHLARLQPDDPIDYLAEYLLRCSRSSTRHLSQ